MNVESKHHIPSAMAVVGIMVVLMLTYVQLSNIKQNSLSNKDLEQQSIRSNDENKLITNELTITKQNLSTLQEKFDKLFVRFENEQEYITVNIEDILRKMDYKYIQYDIKLDEVSHESCDSKFEELYEEIEYIRGIIK